MLLCFYIYYAFTKQPTICYNRGWRTLPVIWGDDAYGCKTTKGETKMKLLYHMPTKVIMGDGCVRAHAALLAGLGKKALIVTGARSAKLCGALDDVFAALETNGQEYFVYDKVMSNPTIDCVYEGAAFARLNGADFVVAIGGGSPMDAAKAIALLARQDIPREELYSGNYSQNVLPMVHIPTTAGTGAEVTQYAILTNDEIQTKKSIAAETLFPRYAFLDARYTAALPLATTVNTALDALSHAVEGMLTVRATVITDALATQSIQQIADCFDALLAGQLSHEQREKLLYASMVAGMVIANTGTTFLHAIGYSLTYFLDIDHGRANGLLMAATLDFISQKKPERVSQILSLMGLQSVGALRDVIDRLLGEKENIDDKQAEKFTQIAAQAKNNVNTIAPPEPADLLWVYKQSFGL